MVKKMPLYGIFLLFRRKLKWMLLSSLQNQLKATSTIYFREPDWYLSHPIQKHIGRTWWWPDRTQNQLNKDICLFNYLKNYITMFGSYACKVSISYQPTTNTEPEELNKSQANNVTFHKKNFGFATTHYILSFFFSEASNMRTKMSSINETYR